MSPKPNAVGTGFHGLGIAPKLLESLERNRFDQPTPIQAKAIPVAIEGKDVIGIAQTGTGKTLAFGIPMIQRLAVTKGRGLVILPTRELALQVEETFNKIGRHLNLRTAVLIGGASMKLQLNMLRNKPHVIIATPGRLNDHLEQRTVKLDDVRCLVLDEADRMLDMGFEPQIRRIINSIPKDRQTLLFSATMPNEIIGMANSYMKTPTRVEIAAAGTAAEKVDQEVFFVTRDEKSRLLEKLLEEYRGTVLVFSRTKHGASKIARLIRNMGHTSAEIHSDRSLAQRRKALDGFKTGEFRVLVATDIAARGIDVKNIELVINYDLPDQSEDYVHRIGRTGRAGASGKAISFAMLDQRQDVKAIERLLRKALPVGKLPELPPARSMPMATRGYEPQDRPFQKGGFGRRFDRGERSHGYANARREDRFRKQDSGHQSVRENDFQTPAGRRSPRIHT
jgi:ATP-dependent RNA helicase RhlE